MLASVSAGTAAAAEYVGKPYEGGDVFADTWVAVDALGRSLPDRAAAGPPRADRWVGVFYWTWHRPTAGGPHDNTRILTAAGAGPVSWPPRDAPHHWGEPELGYYLSTDPFVIRRHASLLADAGVDVVLFDTTNPPHTFRPQYEALCREYERMRAEGARTPAIAFVAPFGDPRPVTNQLWRDLYQPGRWRDLWFRWEGKPLLMADSGFFTEPTVRNFFTFRRPMPDYWQGPSGPGQWSWLEIHPQHVFPDAAGRPEQMSVGVAQNALPGTPGPAPMSHRAGAMGRSWHGGRRDARPGAVDLGLNFDEQWARALKADPWFVFVTGWNEWTSGRYDRWSTYTDADCRHPGGLFVDQYTQEYSRDVEPMRGGHGDNYYYQLAAWVRRYKGVRERPAAPGPSRITIDGSFDDWRAVSREFRDTIGDTIHRDHAGYGRLRYENKTGRNDLVIAKAAYDDTNVSFFAQTAAPITPRTGRNWMLLFIDADQDPKRGWSGYDLAVNLEVSGDRATTVKAWRGGRWEAAGTIPYRVSGNGLELAIPRTLFGDPKRPPTFDFHWADNVASLDTVDAFSVDGDSAPNRRANYRFEVRR